MPRFGFAAPRVKEDSRSPFSIVGGSKPARTAWLLMGSWIEVLEASNASYNTPIFGARKDWEKEPRSSNSSTGRQLKATLGEISLPMLPP